MNEKIDLSKFSEGVITADPFHWHQGGDFHCTWHRDEDGDTFEGKPVYWLRFWSGDYSPCTEDGLVLQFKKPGYERFGVRLTNLIEKSGGAA